jgi:hypothetical protein
VYPFDLTGSLSTGETAIGIDRRARRARPPTQPAGWEHGRQGRPFLMATAPAANASLPCRRRNAMTRRSNAIPSLPAR